MPISLPQLGDSRLVHFSACVWFDKEDAAIQKMGALKKPAHFDSKYSWNSSEHFIQAYSAKADDTDPHLHINIAIRGFFRKTAPTADSGIGKLTSHIERFIGRTAKFILLRGECRVKRNELPAVSLASGLLGKKAKSPSGEILTLSEAAFTISGEPYDRLEWEVIRRPPDDHEYFQGTLFASFSDYELNDDVLVVGFDTIRNGINRFVLEQSTL